MTTCFIYRGVVYLAVNNMLYPLGDECGSCESSREVSLFIGNFVLSRAYSCRRFVYAGSV